jgi:hypothetical protein
LSLLQVPPPCPFPLFPFLACANKILSVDTFELAGKSLLSALCPPTAALALAGSAQSPHSSANTNRKIRFPAECLVTHPFSSPRNVGSSHEREGTNRVRIASINPRLALLAVFLSPPNIHTNNSQSRCRLSLSKSPPFFLARCPQHQPSPHIPR